MARRGHKQEVGYGTSRSSQVRVIPLWQTPISRCELARALAIYLLWRIEQTPETATGTNGIAGPDEAGRISAPTPNDEDVG